LIESIFEVESFFTSVKVIPEQTLITKQELEGFDNFEGVLRRQKLRGKSLVIRGKSSKIEIKR
jgi:hypothetical protein